jgi:orotate phosphoribosyltransferase
MGEIMIILTASAVVATQTTSDKMHAANSVFQDSISILILVVLSLATLSQVLVMTGFIPTRVSNWINRNRLDETMRLLKEFGVDVDTPKRVNSVAALENVAGKTLADRVLKRLDMTKISHPVAVGTEISVPGDHYFDLMGATADLNTAKMYARDLAALWRSLAGLGGKVTRADIDFIVTPKTGSPLLGACVAELLGKPLLLHNPQEKFRSNPDDPRALFDFSALPADGAHGLIVDDSSTGGGKAVKLVDDLRKCGWSVSDFLIVFEPQLKTSTGQNAATRLSPKGIAVHSILET